MVGGGGGKIYAGRGWTVHSKALSAQGGTQAHKGEDTAWTQNPCSQA